MDKETSEVNESGETEVEIYEGKVLLLKIASRRKAERAAKREANREEFPPLDISWSYVTFRRIPEHLCEEKQS